jgi:molybdopterin-guanine dinucleotide biosynthesis protein A
MALAQGLNELTTPWALLLACDMPQLDGAVLQRWIQHLPSVETAAIAYVPYHQNRWEPLCGLYPKTVQSALQTFIVAGGHAFQPWLDVITVVPLAVDDAIASMLWNCNTPEDLTEGG